MSGHDFTRLLEDVRRSGTYNLPAPGREPIVSAAQALGFAVVEISLEGVTNKDQFLDRLATAMHFPEWFGGNWDALSDCLTDLSWMEADGYVLLLTDCERFIAHAQSDFVVAADIFNTAAAVWRDDGLAFWVFADLHPNGLALLPSLT